MTRPLLRPLWLLAAVLFVAALPLGAAAQPFGSWTIWSVPGTGYIQVPHSSALNPTGQITIEGWVDVSDPSGTCVSIVGKGYLSAWWVGLCNNTLRSYLRGGTSVRNGGDLVSEPGWHHFAVTFNGTQRCHYVDGIQAACWVEPVALSTNTKPVRIGSDPDYPFSPSGTINEIRLWNVARTQQQIRDSINRPLTAPQAGLVAVWSNGGPNDTLGPHDGSVVGTVPALTFPVTVLPCSNNATNLCLHDRFNVSVRWKTASDSGSGLLTPLVSFQSGVFYFFNPTNWELMVKVLNGCGLNNRWWVFSAATTNVFYRMEVLDRQAGANKVYFNYAGPPAPAVTDTSAFATCP